MIPESRVRVQVAVSATALLLLAAPGMTKPVSRTSAPSSSVQKQSAAAHSVLRPPVWTPRASRFTRADSAFIAKTYFLRAGGEYDRAELDSALAHFDRGLAWDPRNVAAWQNKAATLGRLKRYEESLAAFDVTLRLKPDYAFAWWHRGCLNASNGHRDEALSDLAHAIAVDSTMKSWPFQDECWDSLLTDPRLLKKTR
jgi:tetratricopeptide (TPR) repeat protein